MGDGKTPLLYIINNFNLLFTFNFINQFLHFIILLFYVFYLLVTSYNKRLTLACQMCHAPL